MLFVCFVFFVGLFDFCFLRGFFFLSVFLREVVGLVGWIVGSVSWVFGIYMVCCLLFVVVFLVGICSFFGLL